MLIGLFLLRTALPEIATGLTALAMTWFSLPCCDYPTATRNDHLAGQARSEFRDCFPVLYPTPLGVTRFDSSNPIRRAEASERTGLPTL